MAQGIVFLSWKVVKESKETTLSPSGIFGITLFLVSVYDNLIYENIKAEICEILRLF